MSADVDLKKATIDAEGLVYDVFYLLAYHDETPPNERHARAPIAPGVARFWIEKEKKDVAAGRPPDAARARVQHWNAVADETWSRVCAIFGDKLVDTLPIVDAFCVVPSSRESIRDPLVAAMRERFSSALELVYSKEVNFFFGGASREDIVESLRREDVVVLPDAAVVVVADDWCGNGTTFRAIVERIRKDHPDRALTFVGAFPGISAPTFTPPPAMVE
jgi:hypothetical protein